MPAQSGGGATKFLQTSADSRRFYLSRMWRLKQVLRTRPRKAPSGALKEMIPFAEARSRQTCYVQLHSSPDGIVCLSPRHLFVWAALSGAPGRCTANIGVCAYRRAHGFAFTGVYAPKRFVNKCQHVGRGELLYGEPMWKLSFVACWDVLRYEFSDFMTFKMANGSNPTDFLTCVICSNNKHDVCYLLIFIEFQVRRWKLAQC